MTGERYTLDANILYYAIDSDASHKHLIAKQLWLGSLTRDCILTVQALGETYHAIRRKTPNRSEDAQKLLNRLTQLVPVIAANVEDFVESMQIQRERRTQFWDTMLWATAKRSGCRTILTEDSQDRPQAGTVRYLNPFTMSSDELKLYL